MASMTVCLRVSVCVRALKRRWPELSTPNLVHIYSMAGSLHALTLRSNRSKVKDTRLSNALPIRWYDTTAAVSRYINDTKTAMRLQGLNSTATTLTVGTGGHARPLTVVVVEEWTADWRRASLAPLTTSNSSLQTWSMCSCCPSCASEPCLMTSSAVTVAQCPPPTPAVDDVWVYRVRYHGICDPLCIVCSYLWVSVWALMRSKR